MLVAGDDMGEVGQAIENFPATLSKLVAALDLRRGVLEGFLHEPDTHRSDPGEPLKKLEIEMLFAGDIHPDLIKASSVEQAR